MNYRAIVMRINKLHALHRYHIFNMIPDVKIYPGQPQMLEYLSGHENCTQAELADFLHVSPASVAVSVKRMQKAGLIGRRADEKDLRCNRIFITESGRRRHELLQGEFRRIDEQLFAGFTEEETERLSGYLDRLIENLSGNINAEEVMDFIIGGKKGKKGCDKADD